MFPTAQTQIGRLGTVKLAGVSLKTKPGDYEVLAAERFAEKISIGPLQFQDLNPVVPVHAVGSLAGGYGLLRFSDNPNHQEAALQFWGTDGHVDTRSLPVTLGSYFDQIFPPSMDGPVVWMGDFTPAGGSSQFVIVAGTRVYTYDGVSSPVLVLTLPAPAKAGTVGVFGRKLLIGFGAAATARYTSDLISLSDVTTGGSPMYVHALTADRAACYAVGSATVTDVHVVQSSPDGAVFSTPVVCGSEDFPITSLAPGGGVALVYVGTQTELACIDSTGVFRVLIPFDSRLENNASPLRWLMGDAGREQQGPLQLVFGREQSIWGYTPDTGTSGTAQNISPWADPHIRTVRPENGIAVARGRLTALQGSARWLFAAVYDVGRGRSWILARDARTARWHIYHRPGQNTDPVSWMAITWLHGTHPRLYYGASPTVIESIVLPLDGDDPCDDVASGPDATDGCRFWTGGQLYYADFDLGFPNEDKLALTLRVIADDLEDTPTSTVQIRVYLTVDGVAAGLIGTATTSPFTDIAMPEGTVGKRFGVTLELRSNDPLKTPKLWAVAFSKSLSAKLYRIWHFKATLPQGSTALGSDDLINARRVIRGYWGYFDRLATLDFEDSDGDSWKVRILNFAEREALRPAVDAIERDLEFTLLQLGPGAMPDIIVSGPAESGAFLPIAMGLPAMTFTVPPVTTRLIFPAPTLSMT